MLCCMTNVSSLKTCSGALGELKYARVRDFWTYIQCREMAYAPVAGGSEFAG
jgi:hypothetical protein